MEELHTLIRSAGGNPVHEIRQRRLQIDPRTYIGTGKLQEGLARLKETKTDVIVADDDLTPAQIRNIEEITRIPAMDRSELILSIFAEQASTREAKDQIELAQLEYLLPRFRRMWTHLSRLEGGIGMRGPGEKQIEIDRRAAKKRIKTLKGRIADILEKRELEASRRQAMFRICLVGYTNAGKSSLLRRMTGSDVKIENRPFSTLETRTRRLGLPDGQTVLLSDTVGFIRKLPHHLVSSFRATLREAVWSDLLLHVVDASSPDPAGQIRAVNEVLDEMGVEETPVFLLFNKSDLPNPEHPFLREEFPQGIFVSARTGEGIRELLNKIALTVNARRGV